MKYKAYLIQEGEGCDYTIGCGRVVLDITARNKQDAEQQLRGIIFKNYNGDHFKIKKAILYEINDTVVIDMDELYNSFNQKCNLCECNLNDGNPLHDDLGGDCLECMAKAGDPDAIERVIKLVNKK